MQTPRRAPYALAAALVVALAVNACGRAPAGVEPERQGGARLTIHADSTASAPESTLAEDGTEGGGTLTDPGAPPPSDGRGGYGVGSGH